jgi:hypothetical protein
LGETAASIFKAEVNVLRLLEAEDEGNIFLQNVGNSLPVDSLYHPRRFESSATLLLDLSFYNILLIML